MEEKDLQNETSLNNVSGEVEDMTKDYLGAIKDLKQNTVERSKYDALKAENKKLLDAVINGSTAPAQQTKPKVDIEELKKKTFFNENQSDLEYITNVLELRDAIIESGQPDPFLPCGQKIIPTEQDIAAAERVAKGLKEMVEVADGNSAVFHNEYERRVGDTIIARKK